MGKGCGNFLAYGVFPESADGKQLFLPSGALKGDKPAALDASLIAEDVASSRFSSPSGLHPSKGLGCRSQKKDAYSWIKAPRYQGAPMEVGPLARVLVASSSLSPGVDPDLRPPEDPAEHLGLPAVDQAGPGGRTSSSGSEAAARMRANAPPSGTPSSQAAAITMMPPGATTRSAAAMPLTAW